MWRRTSAGWLTTSKPATVADPELGGNNVVSILMSVLLLEPLGPIRPNISPRSIVSVT
jgi:hypothetical protein